jgi:3-hydroxymyristoyl/3-hydroxydecanoyl-(acyl carrier protein) dehydratase
MLSKAAKLALSVLIIAGMGFAQTSSAAAAGSQITAGTELHATLDTPLSTRTAKPGDRFTATIAVQVGDTSGVAVIPEGARVEGEVAEADDDKEVAALRGKGKLNLRFRDVVLPNGQTLPLAATLISVHDTSNSSGKNTKKADVEVPSQSGTAGAVADPVSGLIFGSPVKGLAIGALAGGGYVLSIKGKDVNLPAQTGMIIRLDQPVSSNGTSAAIQR